MSTTNSPRKRGLALIAILVAALLVTSMACNLLNFLTNDDEPEPVVEEPVVNQEIEEPVQEEVVEPEPIQQEEPQEEEPQPIQQQPSSNLSGDTLYLIENKQGVVKDEYYTYGVFVVGNPRTDCMYKNAQYDYVVYDASNNELYREESGYLENALPGAQVVEVIYFPEEATDADRFEISLTPGECKAAPTTASSLSVSNEMFYADEYYSFATAILSNSLDEYQTDIFVGALAYDAAGKVVGVGTSYVSQVFPSDYTGVEVYLNVTEDAEVASVEFLPTHSYFSEIGLDTSFFSTAYLADDLPWVQIDNFYETVFYIINDDMTNAATDIEYRLTIVDANNNVLSVETGWIDYVLPGDVAPVYISADLPDNAMAYTHFVELSPGKFEESPFASNPFSTSNYAIDETGWSPVVSFDLTNGSDKAVTGLEMIVVLYDADGNFIGGGRTTSDILSANGTVGQEVYVNVLGEADSVDVYLVVDYWTEIEGWGDN
ncbi:MAG: hypothetical protein V2J07_07145 [Anaerolineae bacterium]|jgi:hypothetical protein|nr:hypothetical protein [Anaerolineae bacterium]